MINENPIKHVYFEQTFESKINKNRKEEECYILPSQIGFSSIEFRLQIREELEYLGMSIEELSNASYIKHNRMQRLIFSTDTFDHKEIKEISRVLGF